MRLEAFAEALNAVGTTLAAAGALATPLLPDIPPAPRHVDCGSCTACCRSLAVFVRPEETGYAVQEGTRILRRREDGACIYLDDERGCTIYERRPVACRAFSCVDYVRNLVGDQPALANEPAQFKKLIAEGRKRLHQPAANPDPTMSFAVELCVEMAAAAQAIADMPVPPEVRVFLQTALAGLQDLDQSVPAFYLRGSLAPRPGRWIIHITAKGHLCTGRGSYEFSTAQLEVNRVFVLA